MIRYQTPEHSDLDDALRMLIKIVIYTYLVITGVLALLAGIIIVAMTVAYLLLRLTIRIVAMVLHKHVGFSLRDALYSFIHQTHQYYAASQGR